MHDKNDLVYACTMVDNMCVCAEFMTAYYLTVQHVYCSVNKKFVILFHV